MPDKRDDFLGLNEIFKADAEAKRQKKIQHQEITVKDYLEIVAKDPLIAQNSPSRLLEAIEAKGTEDIPEHERWMFRFGEDVPVRYNAFHRLYGLEWSIYEVIQYLHAGRKRLSTGKQVLLLIGPTASGKSTFVSTLKHLLENYRNRPTYKITFCPMQEDPLHVIPRHLREEAALRVGDCPECTESASRGEKPKHLHLGVTIEGDLCPKCRNIMSLPKDKGGKYLDDDGTLRWWEIPVENFTFSINSTRGIGSFEPSDEKTQDIGQLVGKENIQMSALKGPSHPDAYDLCGELEHGNRGICEGRELIKAKPEFLWVFISVAEEQEIKVQGSSLPHIPVDLVVIGHTNLMEYKKFDKNQGNEALHDRIYVVPFPYPLKIKDELAIYRKLIHEESDFKQLQSCHIAPGSLEIAALFAIMTRFSEKNSMGIGPLQKAKLYNGDYALTEIRDKDTKPIDLRELIQEGQSDDDIIKREGMHGVSSRDVLAAINTELVKNEGGCLTPLGVLNALQNVFEHRMGYQAENLNTFRELLKDKDSGSVYHEYQEFIMKAIKQAFLGSQQDLVGKLYNDYRENVKLDRARKRKFHGGPGNMKVDKFGRPVEPDEHIMESIEAHFPSRLDKAAIDVHRGEFNEVWGNSEEKSPLVLHACEEKVLHDNYDHLIAVLSDTGRKNEDQLSWARDMFNNLEHAGFCRLCAREAAEAAREFIKGK